LQTFDITGIASLLATLIALLSFHRANKNRRAIEHKEAEEFRQRVDEIYVWYNDNKKLLAEMSVKVNIMYESWFRKREQ
jgi:hypothetical protein